MSDIGEELVVNGDFVMGDLSGWVWNTLEYQKVVAHEVGPNFLVQLPAPAGPTEPDESLRQYFWAGPGTYRLSVDHRATDENGVPQDVRTLHGGGIGYVDANGMPHSVTLLLLSDMQWSTAGRDVTIAEGQPPVEISLNFMNAKGSTNKQRQDIVDSPFALTNISFRRIA